MVNQAIFVKRKSIRNSQHEKTCFDVLMFSKKVFLRQLLDSWDLFPILSQRRKRYTADKIFSGNRRTIKMCCFSTFSSHRGKGENCRGSFNTMDFRITTYFLWWEFIVLRKRGGKAAFGGPPMSRTRSQRNYFITGRCFQQEKEILSFFSPYPKIHTTGIGWAPCWETLSNAFRLCTPLAKQREIYLVQEGSKMTQVICGVWSPRRADTGRPHGVRELKALTRSCCSVPRVCFNCESKFLWYEIYCAGKGKREHGQHSLPKFDREMGKYQRSISKRNRIFFWSFPAVHAATSLMFSNTR